MKLVCLETTQQHYVYCSLLGYDTVQSVKFLTSIYPDSWSYISAVFAGHMRGPWTVALVSTLLKPVVIWNLVIPATKCFDVSFIFPTAILVNNTHSTSTITPIVQHSHIQHGPELQRIICGYHRWRSPRTTLRPNTQKCKSHGKCISAESPSQAKVLSGGHQ